MGRIKIGALKRGIRRGRERQAASLQSQIDKDEQITDQTRSELTEGLSALNPDFKDKNFSSDFSGFSKEFAAAQKGKDPKFRRRQFLRETKNILSDRPGLAKQTILG